MASPLVRDVKSEILEDIIKIRLKTCILSQEFEQQKKQELIQEAQLVNIMAINK